MTARNPGVSSSGVISLCHANGPVRDWTPKGAPMPRRKTAPPDETEIHAETFAAQLNDRFLHCRALGHNWRPHTAEYDQAAGTYDRTLRCSNCRTLRHQVLSSLGGVLSNGYTWPDGYRATNVAPG